MRKCMKYPGAGKKTNGNSNKEISKIWNIPVRVRRQTQIAISKYLNYDLPFLQFSDPSRFPTSGPRARRHKFKTNTYAFRLLQTRIKNRMAFTQIEWILAIRNQSLAICVPQDVCTSDISRHVQNAICFYKYKHVCSHIYFFLCYLFLRIFAATFFCLHIDCRHETTCSTNSSRK